MVRPGASRAARGADSLAATDRLTPMEKAAYADDLARKNSEALSFIPRPMIERYAERGQLMLATENDEAAGFLIHGDGWPQLRIYQACIQYDARRREHGMALVAELAAKARARGCTDVRLWCADDLDSNDFWRAAGFEFCAQRAGGRRRGRKHNLWALRLTPPPLLARLQPDAPVDERAPMRAVTQIRDTQKDGASHV